MLFEVQVEELTVAKESTLYEMLVEDLSEVKASRFLKGYAERSDIIYKEAHTASREGSVHKDYAPYFEGQLLFYLHQGMFITLAADCRLECRIVRCQQNGFPSAVLKVGRF